MEMPNIEQHNAAVVNRQEGGEDVEARKRDIYEKALWLKTDFYADPNDWLGPESYHNVERGEAEKNVHDRRKNKFLKGWFSLIHGFVLENGIRELPADDNDRKEIEGKIAGLWSQIAAEIKRVNDAEILVVKETLCGSDDFKQMVKDFGLTTVSESGRLGINDKDYLYHCIRLNDFNAALSHLWPLEAVQEKFEFSEDKFRQWLSEHFAGWVKKYFELKKEYRAISPETVATGDKILDIVINSLSQYAGPTTKN
jgi:hypothetical protein